MKQILSAFFVLFVVISCSSKKNKAKFDSPKAEIIQPADTFYFEGTNYLKKYINEGGIAVTETQEVSFYKQPEFMIKATSNVSEMRGNYPIYQLKIDAYKEQNNSFDKPSWTKNIDGEVPFGFLWGYFQTKKYGCCSAEDGSTLYSLEDGKEVLKFTGDFEFFGLPTDLYLGYNAVESVNYVFQGDSSIVGNLYYQQSENFDATRVSNYLVRCRGYLADMFIHTPDFKVISKSSLKELGFFKAFKLYKNGEELNKLDTAKYYLTLKYFVKETFLVPVSESGELLTSELITNNKEASKSFSVSKK